jgi:hypothetical protein
LSKPAGGRDASHAKASPTRPARPDTSGAKDGRVKIVDTYIRALQKLGSLIPEVAALEDEVRNREAEVLGKLLALLVPVLPRLVGPVLLHEPWLDRKEQGVPKTLRELGIVVERTFSQHREGEGTHFHHAQLLVVNERGKLMSVEETAQWTEPARTDTRWNVETSEVEVTPTFAAEHIRGVLAGILEVLRDRLSHDIQDKRDLQDRLERLEDAERALG